MSKALVIKGANFSANKVETISFLDPVPCTGITLSKTSINGTKLGVIGTLTATLTPVDTTDNVVWSSADETVATVSNGIVTVVGIGNTTITAQCGNQSASCTISASVMLTASDFEMIMNGNINTTPTQLENGRDYAGVSNVATNKQMLLCTTTPTPSGYRAFTGDNSELYNGKYPLVIPLNASQLVVTTSSSLRGVTPAYFDSTQQPSASVANKGSKLLSLPGTSWGGSPRTITFPTDVSGLDSFVCTLVFTDVIDAIPSDLIVTFS